jgi:predicted Zn-dependent protease
VTKLIPALAAAALACGLILPWAAASAPPKPRAEKPKKDKNLSFEERLQAGKVEFAAEPMTPLTVAQLTEFDIIRDPLMERAAYDILGRLVAAHPGGPAGKPARLPFFVVDGDDINCSTLPTGGAILCTRAVFDQLIAAGVAGKDQLAFLLAHELAHVTIAGHRERFGKSDKLKKDIATAGVVAALVGLAVFSDYKKSGDRITMQATRSATNVFWITLGTGLNMGEFANGLAAPSWAKRDEEDADAFAMILLRDAGFEINAGNQFLNSADRTLRANKMRSTKFGQMFKQAGQGALLQGLLSKGDTVSIIIGAVGGALSGWAQEGALAHYHRTPDKRAAACAQFVKAHAAAREAATPGDEAAELFASYDRLSSPAAAVAAAAAAAAAATAAPRGRRRASRVLATPVISDSWDLFLRSPGPIAQLIISNRIRELLADDHVEEALALCPDRFTVSQLMLACGIAYAGVGEAGKALPLLTQAMSDPEAPPETFRWVAHAQASLGLHQIALQTTARGIVRYPAGNLYPDEIMIRAAIGDMTGAQTTATTCQKNAAKEFQDACARGWAALQSSPAEG